MGSGLLEQDAQGRALGWVGQDARHLQLPSYQGGIVLLLFKGRPGRLQGKEPTRR